MKAEAKTRREAPDLGEVGGYQLLRCLGAGAMGSVFLARDNVLERHVAIKFLRARGGESAKESILAEARAAARIEHPNLAVVHSVGESDGRPYLVTEYVRGPTLEALKRPVAMPLLMSVAVGVARGLSAAHRRGVIHRDIKPANVILGEDGVVKLVDFGLAAHHATKVGGESMPPRAEPARPLRETRPMRETRPSGVVAWKGDGEGKGAPIAPASDSYENEHDDDEDDDVTSGGTPLYMAPEVLDGHPSTPQSDIYSLGAMLLELGSPVDRREPPSVSEVFALAKTRVDTLATPPTGWDKELAAVVRTCLAEDPADRFGSADAILSALDRVQVRGRTAILTTDTPYRGLDAFQSRHRSLFFGREADARAVVDILRGRGLVVVAGDSGVGKSSLCRAGIVPLVEEGALHPTRTYRSVTIVPATQPVSALAAAVAPILGVSEAELERDIRNEPSGTAREIAKNLGGGRGLIILVDQLEELVTLTSPVEATTFLRFVRRLATTTSNVRILCSVRGDFLTRVAAVDGFGEDVVPSLFLLGPLGHDAIRDAIVRPAGAYGTRFETEAMIEKLVEITAKTQAGLPLLQFALTQLWKIRDSARGVITEQALEAIGGIAGALARHADAVLARLSPNQRLAARRVLLRLVTSEGTRTRRIETQLIPPDAEARGTLSALVDGRLIVALESPEGPAYEVAHESLIQGWPTLRGWLADAAETRAARERVAIAAAAWAQTGRRRGLLWSAEQVTDVESDLEDLLPVEREFLARSSDAAKRQRWIRRGLLAALPLALLAVVGVTEARERARARAVIATHLDAARTVLTEARRGVQAAAARRADAFAAFDSADAPHGDAAWRDATGLEQHADETLSRAAQTLEAALVLDPRHPEIRALLADALFDRAELAEKRGHATELADIAQRLTVYDDGSRSARLTAKAHLSLDVDPAAKLTLIPQAKPGETPRDITPNEELPAGSYVIAASAPGKADVRLPVHLSHGETLRAGIELPPKNRIPKGFIFIPSGRFLFGTNGDERIRREFFHTSPLHQMHTGAYMIAEHETTYGEWLAFLDTLPASDRKKHMPHVTAAGFRGSLDLVADAGGDYRLHIQPSTQPLVSDERGVVVYAAREARREQRWFRMPVTGIEWDDVTAYTSWLDKSGRVPGARPCSELEWERAARGADGREFPAGEHIGDANIDEASENTPARLGPDEVGSHEGSASPFGVQDMAGNVWEWVSSSLGANEQVIRGGAFPFSQTTCSSVNREIVEPTLRDVSVGLRVCATR